MTPTRADAPPTARARPPGPLAPVLAALLLGCSPGSDAEDWPAPTPSDTGDDQAPEDDDTAGYTGFFCLDDVSWSVVGVRQGDEEWMGVTVDRTTRGGYRLGAVNESGAEAWLGEACIDGSSDCHTVEGQTIELTVVATTGEVVLSDSTFFGFTQFEQSSWVLHDGEGRCSTFGQHATVYRDAGCCAQP